MAKCLNLSCAGGAVFQFPPIDTPASGDSSISRLGSDGIPIISYFSFCCVSRSRNAQRTCVLGRPRSPTLTPQAMLDRVLRSKCRQMDCRMISYADGTNHGESEDCEVCKRRVPTSSVAKGPRSQWKRPNELGCWIRQGSPLAFIQVAVVGFAWRSVPMPLVMESAIANWIPAPTTALEQELWARTPLPFVAYSTSPRFGP